MMNPAPWFCLSVALRLLLPLDCSAASLRPPNFLFLFADDHAYEAIGALGHTDIETPNLDRLVTSGTTFTHAYNMGGWHGAICVASRTMLNTGRTVWRARELEPRLNEEVAAGKFWPQLLANAGYQTFFAGKWHVSVDATKVFQHTRHIRPGMPKDVPLGYQRPIAGQPDPWSPSDPKFGGFWEGGRHWSEVLADDAKDFFELATASEQPFFMYLAFNAPHDPRQSPEEFLERYPLERIRVPENFLPEYPHMEGMGAGKELRDEKLAPWPRTEHAVKVHRREYYALVTHLDAQIGRVLEALKATGRADNTVIIFTADHGLAVGHHGLLGKQNMYEHSLRAPLIVTGPGIPAGKRIDARVYIQDVLPTTLKLAGIAVPAHVEFKSLLPLVRGERTTQYDAVYAAYMPDRQRAVIAGDHKLIHYPAIDVYRLFNLKTDPREKHDLIGDPDSGSTIASLKAALARLERDMGGPMASR